MNGSNLTLEEQACNYATMLHIARVRDLLNVMVKELLDRGRFHDLSKLMPPEVAAFTKMTPELSGLTYGTPEYDASKVALGEALQHHYAKNRHHPEHFKRGIRDMNLIDLLEAFCDWKAGSERHTTGNLRKSIQINAGRFQMPPELVEIFENTVELVETP